MYVVSPRGFRCDFRCALVLVASLGTALYKLLIVGLHPLELFLACSVDVLVWAWLLVANEAAAERAEGTLRRVTAGAFLPLFYLLLVCDLAHASFYEVATERRFSLFDVGPTEFAYFFRHVASTRWVLGAALFAVVLHAAAWALRSRRLVYPVRPVLLGLGALTALVAVASVFAPRVPSPLFDTARDVYDLATLERVVPVPPQRPDEMLAVLDRSSTVGAVRAPAFSRILVFVMETVPTRDFEAERALLPKGTFFRTMDEHSHRYDRYYATNQDSRTGMLDMLGSRQVPYEAYTEYGLGHYAFLSQKTSLVHRFDELGYATAYAVSHADHEAVIRDLPWTRMLTFPEARIAATSSKYLCVTRYEFEHGCEDRVLLPEVFDFIDQHPHVFLYQEFIWGHDSEYNEASGRTNADYYSSYLDQVVGHLRERNQLDDTLIVLTSDHGYRSRKRLNRADSYELPLLFFSTRFSAAHDKDLRSHLDFKDLLLHEAGSRPAPTNKNPFVMNVGPTGAGTLAVIGDDGRFLLLRTRETQAFILAEHGGAARTEDSASSMLGVFQEYRRRFDLFGQGGPSPSPSIDAVEAGPSSVRETAELR